MITKTRNKNSKILSPMDNIEFLTRLKTQDLPDIAKHFGISLRAVQYKIKKYNAYSDEQIDRAILNLEKKFYTYAKVPTPRNYEKEENCSHNHPSVFIKCPDCGIVVGENEHEKALCILQNIKPAKKLIEVNL